MVQRVHEVCWQAKRQVARRTRDEQKQGKWSEGRARSFHGSRTRTMKCALTGLWPGLTGVAGERNCSGSSDAYDSKDERPARGAFAGRDRNGDVY